MHKDRIYELIDMTPKIKENFHAGDGFLLSTYDRQNRCKVTTSTTERMIYDNPAFMAWRDELKMLISQLKQDKFTEDLIRLLSRFTGFSDDSRFRKIESQLNVLKMHLDDYIPSASDVPLSDTRIPETELVQRLERALLKMQRNHRYDNSCDENTMNDYIRDILDETYQTKDQTRQGISENGADAGEIDIQLLDAGIPIVMIEGLILDSVVKSELHGHLNKLLTNYDPNGCPYSVLLIYYKGANLDGFHKRMIADLNSSAFEFPFQQVAPLESVNTGVAELKHAQTVLIRSGQNVRVHIFSVTVA